MVRDSATQTSDGKLMSADPKISITCSFRKPEGLTSYTSVDTPRMIVFMVNVDWAYPQLCVSDHIVTGSSVFG